GLDDIRAPHRQAAFADRIEAIGRSVAASQFRSQCWIAGAVAIRQLEQAAQGGGIGHLLQGTLLQVKAAAVQYQSHEHEQQKQGTGGQDTERTPLSEYAGVVSAHGAKAPVLRRRMVASPRISAGSTG